LVAYAFNCANLLYHREKTIIFFPLKRKKKENKKEKKDMQIQQQ